jgi:hypothetical protein
MTSPVATTIRQDVFSSGLIMGLIGYAVVAFVTAVLNIGVGRSPFYTAALFGSALFYDLADPGTLTITAAPVFAYNALHLLVFLALGFLIAWLVTVAERHPAAAYIILLPLLFVAAHMFLALVIFARPLLGDAGPVQIGLASVAATFAMGWYAWRSHPLLRDALRDVPLGAVGDDT